MSSRTFKEALDKLKDEQKGWKAFDRVPAQGGRPGQRSTGRPSSAATAGATLVFEESDYTLRQYWTERPVAVSSDGLMVVYASPIKSIELVGGTAAAFDEPV
tara:strand:- start:18787 stop:19092 length:306 start_codon:yes stop_codon:yes gene_type:complete